MYNAAVCMSQLWSLSGWIPAERNSTTSESGVPGDGKHPCGTQPVIRFWEHRHWFIMLLFSWWDWIL